MQKVNATFCSVFPNFFDQLDIISALAPGHYLTGPYAAIAKGGAAGDGQTSVTYNPADGEVGVMHRLVRI